MKRGIQVCTMAMILGASLAWAQQPPPGGPGEMQKGGPGGMGGGMKGGDPLMENFFPPEMLMQYSSKLGLTDEQQKLIKAEMQQAQVKFVDLQWQLSADKEALAEMIQGAKVDEKVAIPQVEKVLKAENEIKVVHVTLALRIKNALTLEQQEQLRDLMKAQRQQGQNRKGPGKPDGMKSGKPDGMEPGGEKPPVPEGEPKP